MYGIGRFFSKKFFLLTLILLSVDFSFAMEGDIYDFSWLDPDKEIYVLQNRKFRKYRKLFFSFGYGKTTSGPFIDSTGFQARAGYFAMENFGFEFLYSQNYGKENSTAYSVRNQGGKGSTPFSRIVNNYMGGLFVWSPFYAKVNTFNSIVYIDWMIAGGIGKLDEDNNMLELDDPNDKRLTRESHTGIMAESALQLYFTQTISFRLDLIVFRYMAKEGVTGSTHDVAYYNYDMGLSLGLMF